MIDLFYFVSQKLNKKKKMEKCDYKGENKKIKIDGLAQDRTIRLVGSSSLSREIIFFLFLFSLFFFVFLFSSFFHPRERKFVRTRVRVFNRLKTISIHFSFLSFFIIQTYKLSFLLSLSYTHTHPHTRLYTNTHAPAVQ